MEIIDLLDIKPILSLISLVAGIVFYIGWGTTYGVWADIGVYSLTIVLVLSGVFGLLLWYFKTKKDKKE